MKLKLLALFATLAGGCTLATASTHVGIGIRIGAPPPVIVREAPPRRVVEVVSTAPGSGYVWVAGHHSWRDGQWVWVPGEWAMPPQAGAVWVDGRWDEPTRAWTEGHWEIAQPSAPPPAPAVVVGATAPRTEVIIAAPPPPLRIEHHGRPPGRGFVWINGYWAYRGGHHVWVSGRWDRPPHGHRVWVEPRWERRGGSYVFIEGRWN